MNKDYSNSLFMHELPTWRETDYNLTHGTMFLFHINLIHFNVKITS